MVIDRSGGTVIGPIRAGLGCFSEGLAPINMGYGWKYIDSKGAVAIQGPIDFATEFSEGLASTKVGSKCAYINKEGKYAIPPFPCSWAGRFQQGLARVEVTKSVWGYIDRVGKMVISPQFNNAEDFSEGLAHVESGHKHMFIDKNGKIVLSSVADTPAWPALP